MPDWRTPWRSLRRGTRLASLCAVMLDEAEQKVVKLQKGPDGEPVELPFGEEEG